LDYSDAADGIPVAGWVAQLPIAGEYLDRWWQANLINPRAVVEWLRGVDMESLTAWTSALGGELLHRLFLFLITLMALFLVLRLTAYSALPEGAWRARPLTTFAARCTGPWRLHSRKPPSWHRFVLAGVPHPLLFAVEHQQDRKSRARGQLRA
jgi:hypothetical protein